MRGIDYAFTQNLLFPPPPRWANHELECIGLKRDAQDLIGICGMFLSGNIDHVPQAGTIAFKRYLDRLMDRTHFGGYGPGMDRWDKLGILVSMDEMAEGPVSVLYDSGYKM